MADSARLPFPASRETVTPARSARLDVAMMSDRMFFVARSPGMVRTLLRPAAPFTNSAAAIGYFCSRLIVE
jgi:hypothetical protein